MYLPTTKPWHVTWFFQYRELFLGAKLNDSLIFHKKNNLKNIFFQFGAFWIANFPAAIIQLENLKTNHIYIVCTLENQIDETSFLKIACIDLIVLLCWQLLSYPK